MHTGCRRYLHLNFGRKFSKRNFSYLFIFLLFIFSYLQCCVFIVRAFDVELLYIAQKLKIALAEVAINWIEIEGLSHPAEGNCSIIGYKISYSAKFIS